MYVPSLPAGLLELINRIEAAVTKIIQESLIIASEELAYRFDMCCVTDDAHIEHLYGSHWTIFKMVWVVVLFDVSFIAVIVILYKS